MLVSPFFRPVLLLSVLGFSAGLFAQSAAPVDSRSNDVLSIEERLQRVERRATRISDLTLQVQALQQENRELRGEIETQAHMIEQLKRKQRDLYLDVDQRLSDIQAGGSASAANPVATTKPTTAPATPAEKPAEPVTPVVAVDSAKVEAEYKAAYALLTPQQRRYKEAVAALKAFLKKYPDSALASNAQYWLGEAYYVSQDNKNALASFKTLVEKYPDSTKVAGALYKIGRIQYVSGDVAAAKKSLARVQKEHSESSAAGLAAQMLKRIERETK